MTIETSPPANARNPAVGHSSKARTASADEPGSGGFMAMLDALADGDASADAPITAAPDAVNTADAAWPDTSAFDAATLLQQNAQLNGTPVVSAQALAGTAPTGTAANAGVPGTSAAIGAAGGIGSPDGPDSAMPLASPASADESPATAAVARPPRSQAPAGAAGEAGALAGSAPAAPEGSAASTQGLQRAMAHRQAAQEAQQTATASTNNTAAASAERPGSGHGMAAAESAAMQQNPREAEAVFLPLLARQDKPQGERAAAAGKAGEGLFGGSPSGVNSPTYSPAAPQEVAMAPDMAAAEQVTYWVSQNMQNAELTLDGLGQLPVEVSISLQGKEAQIAFRSDEAGTRSVLESAGSHLKDLLQREGLVLTGVSVGGSGNGEAGAGAGNGAGEQRRARQSMRQGLVAPLQPVMADAARRANPAAGRSVDLFV